MILTRRVADGTWVTVYGRPAVARLHGAERRQADREAAERAWNLAAAAAGLCPQNAAGSRAHTEGSGAALVGPAGTMMGVDLVSMKRVTPRHAQAMLDAQEWDAVEGLGSISAALAWGLKEAAAKAFGEPGRRFPAGLRIAGGTNGLTVATQEEPSSCVVGRWELIGSLLCVWVLGAP